MDTCLGVNRVLVRPQKWAARSGPGAQPPSGRACANRPRWAKGPGAPSERSGTWLGFPGRSGSGLLSASSTRPGRGTADAAALPPPTRSPTPGQQLVEGRIAPPAAGDDSASPWAASDAETGLAQRRACRRETAELEGEQEKVERQDPDPGRSEVGITLLACQFTIERITVGYFGPGPASPALRSPATAGWSIPWS